MEKKQKGMKGYLILLFSFCSFLISAQDSISSTLDKCVDLFKQQGELVVFAFANVDSSKLYIIYRHEKKVPTSQVINDQSHNKVNFITQGKPDENIYTQFPIRVSAYYHHKASNALYEQTLIDSHFIQSPPSDQLLLSLLYQKTGDLSYEETWGKGVFASIPDLRLDPNWDDYGKNVWKRKEESMRPFIGLPSIMINYDLKKKSP